MSGAPKGVLASFLVDRGWQWRAYADSECGTPSDHGPSGWCPTPAHWHKTGRRSSCAVHARISERYHEEAKR